ncbi:tachykinin family protein [Colletotrichum karsti]|uniref:Tachykinin family protein n=1 Tax=Colletotrichum karsti TaxID=1095194 RepID=A0A9P6IHL6_9PEZI|nr:tachykinin family protein [Colletotrichum karsti]KAF9882491.1 tachykinin family protein [Colletotrichum karsti]
MCSTPQYKFVTFGDEEGSFQPADKATRSHAIRTAIQRGPSEIGANTALTSKGTITHKSQLKGRFRLSGTSSRPAQKRGKQATSSDSRPAQATFEIIPPSPLPPWIQRLGSDNADPFNTLPIPSNPSVDSLVKYFITRFNLNSTTTDTQRPWFPYAMQSALIMRVTLSLAAEFLNQAMPLLDLRLKREGYRQKGEAMRMIRNRLESQESARSASEDLAVLAGVAMLGSVEAFQGNFDAANVHLTGLYAMIEARGGPDTIRHDYILCRCINWIDIQVASGLGRIPKFPMFHTLDQVSLPSSVVNRAMTPSLRHMDKLGGHNPGESNEPRKIFTTLRQAIFSQAGSVSADTIRIVMNTADSSILQFLYVERRSATPVQKRFLVLVSAAQVFLYAVLREIPTTGHMVRILVARLRAALDDADSIALVWVSHDATLMWVLFVGIVGSGTTEDRQWFTCRLHDVLDRARDILPPDRCDRQSLQQLLAGFLWLDRFCLPVLDEIWVQWERNSTQEQLNKAVK